ncbi:RSC complex protein [Ephemerocybe angulata]|uniref:RSC complex protein n=1 Tax=Ephemerocybe angulata TaxID=980116 RepID=A0A8H6IJK1_9AGAR|nr:RSC complex protein [Tulosesus angulatus]
MMKREANGAVGVAEGSRSKRPRREADAGATSDGDNAGLSDDHASDGEGSGARAMTRVAMDPQEVKRHGLHIWNTVKDAVNKEGRIMSTIFMHKPPKKEYPDYYFVIKQPIAMDIIKGKIDKGAYLTLEDVRRDFELMFTNAKTYNQKDSMVWLDAKDLLKLVNKLYAKIIPPQEGEEKKSKPPSLNRMLKTRLQKLIEKTDAYGRFISTEFMQLPDRKVWAIYYQQIKKPQCFDTIFSKLKRKEYFGANDFAADVELIFSNAMAFNLEHTQIWEDALALRNTFRQLMSDLPPPHSLPQYQLSAKIKIKPQGTKAEPTLPSLTLRVPTSRETLSSAGSSVPCHLSRLQLPSPLHSVPPHYPPTASVPSNVRVIPSPAPPMPTAPPASSHVLRASSAQNVAPPVAAPTPPPAPPLSQHQLKSVKIQVQPRGRTIYLHHTDGVKSWALRMLPGETRIIVSDVVFQTSHDEDDDESSDEDEGDEEDYDEDMAVDTSPRNGKKKGKGRKRDRLPTAKSAKKKSSKPGEVQLKVNGLVIREQAEQAGEWDIHLPMGSNTLEVGEVGGLIWKVYAERVGGL